MRLASVPRIALLCLLPLLVAAADAQGDVAGCRRGADVGAPDLVEARGDIVEVGTSARWRLTFAQPLVVPDAEGRPFRVDIAIHDPGMPSLTFGYYRNVNRLIRVDATIDHATEIYLLPERGSNVFNPPVIDGNSMTIQVPGRTLSDDEDLTGTSPGLEALRWTVIVRDERACDFLGDGRPTERLVRTAEEPSPPLVGSPAGTGSPERSPWWVWGGGAAVATIALFAAYRRQRARREDGATLSGGAEEARAR